MTIKDVELQTGLARANIRYYEDQGFFSAARGENGYRNYSDENVDILLRVKLLRQLGFSLEEIHALQKGEQSLDRALAERESGLEAERRALDQALELCRAMRQEGADFYTLDARRYLNRLAQERVLEQDRDPVRIFPWRRLFAREIDSLLCLTALVVLLQLFARINLIRVSEDAGSLFLLHLGAMVLLLGMETLSLALTGTTPGKLLFGLKILREDGSKLDFAEAGQRTVYVVLFYGFAQTLIGSRIPLLSIAGIGMLVWACWQVYHEKTLFWEADQLYLDGSTKERAFWDNRWNYLRVAGYLAAWALCLGLMAGGGYLAARPPHRGASLTAEEFVDNYNQCMAFAYGEEHVPRRLTLAGTFEEEPSQGVVIYMWGEPPVPEGYFIFDQEGDRLRKVVFTRTYEGGGPLEGEKTYSVDIPYDEIYVAMRSFLWGRLGDQGVRALYEALTEGEGNYHASLKGVQVDSAMRFSGYSFFGERVLFAQEGETQSYFVEFAMEWTE